MLAGTADITLGLQLGRAEVLRGLRNFLNTDRAEHHSTDRLKERGDEKGSGQHSTLRGLEQSVFNRTNTGTVSRATLGRPLGTGRGERGGELVWAFLGLQCHLEVKMTLKLKLLDGEGEECCGVGGCRVLRQGPAEKVCGDGEDCECCHVCCYRLQGSTPRTR